MPLTIKVRSTNIKSCEYDAETKTLTVRFHRGGTYQYRGVPAWEIERLMESESSGRYFYRNIRDHYTYTKLQDA